MKKKISCLILALVIAFGLTGCGARFLKDNEIADVDVVKGTIYITYYQMEDGNEYDAVHEIELPFELDYQSAPNTVANFYSLAKAGEYDNTLVSQPANSTDGVKMGGNYFGKEKDEDGKETDEINYAAKLTKDVGYHIIGEFEKNGWEKNANVVETYAMYMVLPDASDYNSASAEFGISLTSDENKDKSSALHKTRCVFGMIVGDGQGEIMDMLLNASYIDFGNSETCAKITGITFDKEYDLKLVKC